jgi:hypothetical protein
MNGLIGLLLLSLAMEPSASGTTTAPAAETTPTPTPARSPTTTTMQPTTTTQSSAKSDTSTPTHTSITLTTADKHVLLLPDRVRVGAGGTVDVHVHLKGSPESVASAVEAVDPGTLVIVVSEPGLSKAYAGPFSDPRLLRRMIDESLAIAGRRAEVPDQVRTGRLTIASFSAGYAAVRELLKHDAWFQEIDGLLFLDSIYAGYVSETDRRPIPEQMADFCRFAEAASRGDKVMIVTHTRLAPAGYAGTHETADVILSHLKLDPVPQDARIADGLVTYRVARRGGFHLVGTRGDDGAEHGRILAQARLWLGTLFGQPGD